MEIIHLLRKWKFTYIGYRNRRKYNNVDNLNALLRHHSNIESIGITRVGLILKLKNNVNFEWDLRKPNSFLIATSDNYEKLERSLIEKILKPGDTVFDIGANFGYFTVLMKRFCPDICLYSFEPIRTTYATLLRNLKHNQLDDVKAYNFGFSNEQAMVTFYIPEQLGDAWASMGTGVKTVFNYKLNKEICQVQKIDDFVVENSIEKIDFIKCDVEGAEKLIVEGGMQTLKNHQPTIMLEIGNMWTASFGYNRQQLIGLMIEEFGYKCFGILEDIVVELPQPELVQKYPEQHMYNYFFVNPSKLEVMDSILSYIGKK